MMIYWFIFIYTTVVSMVVNNMSKNRVGVKEAISGNIIMVKRVGFFGAIITFFLVTFYAGHRCDVADSATYMTYFSSINYEMSYIPELLKSDVKSPLFDAIVVVCKRQFNFTYHGWFMVLAIFQGICVARFIGKFSTDFSFSSYMFIADISFFWMYNGIRQFTAVCIVLFTMEQYFNKKWIPFLISIFVAYYIHSSVAIWLFFCFQSHWKPFAFRTIVVIIVAVIVFVVFINTGLEGTDYEGYDEQSEEDDGVNVFQVLIYAVPVGIAFIKRDIIFSKKRPRYIDVMINLSIAIFCLDFVGMFTSGVLIGRLPIYFSLCNLVLVPWLVDNAFSASEKGTVKKLAYAGYFGYYIYYTYVANNGLTYHSRSLGIALYSGRTAMFW